MPQRPVNEDANYEVVDAEMQSLLRDLADTISHGGEIPGPMPECWGFTLFLFTYAEPGAVFYISTAQREDMVRVIEEWLMKQKAHTDA